MKLKESACKRCKNKRPNFSDYLSEIFDFDLKNGKDRYNYCKVCGQFYKRKATVENFGTWYLPLRRALFVVMILILLMQPVFGDLTDSERIIFNIFVFPGGAFLTIWLHYILTKFDRINMKASSKYLKEITQKKEFYIIYC